MQAIARPPYDEMRVNVDSAMGRRRDEVTMREIKVLGTGCANCRMTASLLEEVARFEKSLKLEVQRVQGKN